MTFTCLQVGVKVRAALLMALARKALHTSHLGSGTEGDIVSAVANDISKVYDAMQVCSTPAVLSHCVRLHAIDSQRLVHASGAAT